MHSKEQLIQFILDTPPHQLPPVVKSDGCYSLDIVYLGQKYHKVGLGLEEMLEGYWHFVTKCNFHCVRHEDVLRDLPVPAGMAIYPMKN